MKVNNKKKLLIFDLDGVIFNSKKNMEIAWNKTSEKFNLNINFSKYFSKIGMPFMEILKSLEVEPRKDIYKCFKDASLENINVIKPYKNVTKMLHKLKKTK